MMARQASFSERFRPDEALHAGSCGACGIGRRPDRAMISFNPAVSFSFRHCDEISASAFVLLREKKVV